MVDCVVAALKTLMDDDKWPQTEPFDDEAGNREDDWEVMYVFDADMGKVEENSGMPDVEGPSGFGLDIATSCRNKKVVDDEVFSRTRPDPIVGAASIKYQLLLI